PLLEGFARRLALGSKRVREVGEAHPEAHRIQICQVCIHVIRCSYSHLFAGFLGTACEPEKRLYVASAAECREEDLHCSPSPISAVSVSGTPSSFMSLRRALRASHRSITAASTAA